jgi:hypothetical protein
MKSFSFAVRTLEDLVIFDLFLCLVNLPENPLELSRSSHPDPTKAFSRSNPELYQFRKH